MPIPYSYSKETFLHEPLGNNAFDFEERSGIHPDPYLRIAPVKEFKSYTEALKELSPSYQKIPAFSAIDNEQIKSFLGLETFLQFPNPFNQSPVFVFDNHNHAFFFWHWWANLQQLKTPFTLIHIDQHKDTRIPIEMLSPEDSRDEKKLYQYTNEILNVGNFIPPAIKTGLLQEILIVDSSASLQSLLTGTLPDHYILDIDLDFFTPDLDYLNNSLKIEAIKKALSQAAITTIATSPYFIEDQLAFQFLRKIFS